MCTSKEKGCWIQCTMCGEIYHIKEPVPIDQLYVTSECARCGHDKGLNCENNRDEIYRYYDPVMDERYYQY